MTQLRQSLRLILAAVIALSLSASLHWSESYWIVISALLALQITSNPLVRYKDFFLLGTGVMAAALAVLSSLLAPHIFAVAVLLLVSAFVTVNIGLTKPVFWGATFLINYFATLSSGFVTDVHSALLRFLAILSGFLLAILLQRLFFPSRLPNDCKLVLAECLRHMQELNQAVFDCFVAANYKDKQFTYEKKLHKKRRDVAYAISVARQLIDQVKPPKQQALLTVFCAIEQMYETLLSMSLLDTRIDDRSTFELVQKEFFEIAENISQGLSTLKIQLLKGKRPTPYSEVFKENIYQLEDVSRATIDVAAKDPVVFVLFVQDLYALNEWLKQLSLDITLLEGGSVHAEK